MQPILSVVKTDMAGGANKDVARVDIEVRQQLPQGQQSPAVVDVQERPIPPDVGVSSEMKLENVAANLQKYIQDTFSRELSIVVDKELGRPIVRIVDSTTKQVIRQFPPEELLSLYRRIRAGQESGGMLLKEIV